MVRGAGFFGRWDDTEWPAPLGVQGVIKAGSLTTAN